MDRSRAVCRHFINGFCRFGLRCKYRHETTPIPASQICRYFQKGGCWYGERCRYLHITLPHVGHAVPGRRGSMPTAVSPSVPYSSSYARRGSEPALGNADVPSRQRCSGPQSAAYAFTPQQDTGHLPENIVEEQPHENEESAHSSGIAQASAWHGADEHSQGPSKSETQENGATAACSNSVEPLLKSKNVVCGICMEKVYEKEEQRNRVFGILPNCNHPFCLKCIATWRKTKDLGPGVVRACPQCRVRSAFYVPNKHWVEGEEKENLITAFKKKLGKRRCSFFERNGFCPFKKDCLYEHVLDSSHVSFSYFSDDSDDDDSDLADLLNIIINMSLWRQEELDEDLLFFLTEDLGF
ncbi:makorin, ring finger protein, 4 isoform X1 [Cyprinodon tularosa]|uniref:makorin, ring finger protein, 4 isoform X1 n=1 Tax=Cyprinodon tularosa TaxID=77115 RepID=UPI0018E21ABE|nr:makorin, ring finger protein, 4 isoform X1 [Cyprinodon tularosa]